MKGGAEVKKRTGPAAAALLPVQLLCCLLGGCALCFALLPALGQEVSMGDCLALIAVDLSLIFVLSRRWWLTPLLLLLLALAGLAAAFPFHLLEPMLDYARGFLEWYAAACPYTLPYSVNGSLFLVHLAFSFPAALLLYVYFRRFPLPLLWFLLSAGVLLWMFYTGAEGLLGVLALLLMVMIVLLATANARSIDRKLGAGETIPAGAMQLTALALAPLLVLLAFALGPKTDGAWQSRGLVDLVADLGDVFSYYGEGSSAGGSFDLSYSGLAPRSPALGGDIDPDNRTVLRVRTSTPILLVGTVYDTYDGHRWYDAYSLGRFRFQSPLWRGRRREVFTLGKPSGKAAAAYKEVSRTAGLEISMAVRFRTLFAGGKLEQLTLPYGEDGDVFFNRQGEVFTLEVPTVYPSYVLRTRVFDREKAGFDEGMRRLLQAAETAKDREYEEICREYTVVPDTVEPFVHDLARELTESCATDYDKALAIETWLGEACTYTKTPGDPPEGRDFVSAFLETREGYCTYYASAMTVLARIAGLPARYVTGYGLRRADSRPDSGNYLATNATAHAWTQVYFYGVGWMDFDPTHWDFSLPVEKDSPVLPEPKTEDKPPVPETPKPELPAPEATEAPSPESKAGKRSGNGKLWLLLLGGDLGAFLIFLLIRFALLFFRTESLYGRLCRRFPDSGSRADECYRRILKQLRFLGLELRPGDTILSFCARADEALGLMGEESLTETCRSVLLYRFADRRPTDGEVKRLCETCISLEKRLRRELGWRSYVLRRMLLGR